MLSTYAPLLPASTPRAKPGKPGQIAGAVLSVPKPIPARFGRTIDRDRTNSDILARLANNGMQ